ncbi:MAG: hypothetical protein ABW168_03330, partial [Sedimenticola sp.]
GHPCLRLHVPFFQGPWLDLHQLADYHAGHTPPVSLRSTGGAAPAKTRSKATTKTEAKTKPGQRRPAASKIECVT